MKILAARKFLTAVLVFAGLAVGSGNAYAIPLSDLLTGGSITVLDKLFDTFEVEFNGGGKFVDTSLIDVTGLDDQPNNPGLKFTAEQGALTVEDFFDFDINFAFNFAVTVLDPNKKIKDASLALTDFTSLDPFDGGYIQINDFAFDSDMNGLADLNVYGDPFFGPTTDSAEFAPQSMLFQEIHIVVETGFDGEPTGINMFEIRKSQIPEPTTLLLLSAGLIGFGARLRKS